LKKDFSSQELPVPSVVPNEFIAKRGDAAWEIESPTPFSENLD